MFRFPATTLRASAFAISALLATAIAVPAAAQVNVSVSFDSFHNRLAPYGTWSNSARWGEVWRPRAQNGFKPYYNGHWEDTNEYGWLWVSEDAWGDTPYHYGRWVSDPRDGWLWVPGYVWGPSWVVWRSGGGNIGWFPMPPGDNYYGDGAYRDDFSSEYGYRDWYGPSFSNSQFESLWIFVGEDHFRDRNFRNYAVPQRDYGRFFSQTRNTTNYVTINNYVVNRSVDGSQIKGAGNRPLRPVSARSVLGRDAQVTQVDAGRQIEQRERQQHPIPANINPAEQRGRGNANPTAQQPNVAEAPGGPASSNGPNVNTPRDNPRIGRGVIARPAMPTAPETAPTDTPRENGRGQANTNPVAEHGSAAPTPATAPTAKVATPALAERRNSGTVPGGPSNNAPANPQTDRKTESFRAPVRDAAEPPAKAVVQETRTPSARAQGAGPGPHVDVPDNVKNQARGNRQGDEKKANESKATDDKKDVSDRGRN